MIKMPDHARFVVGKYYSPGGRKYYGTIYGLTCGSFNTIWVRSGRDFKPSEMEKIAGDTCDLLVEQAVREVRLLNGGKVPNPIARDQKVGVKKLPRARVYLLREKLEDVGLEVKITRK